jgi:hypothetical protein
MEDGFTFTWKPKRPPYFITPDGRRIMCEVHNRCPYLAADAPICAAVQSAGDDVSVDSEAATVVAPCGLDAQLSRELEVRSEAADPCADDENSDSVISVNVGDRDPHVGGQSEFAIRRMPPAVQRRLFLGRQMLRLLIPEFPCHAGVLTKILLSEKRLVSLESAIDQPASLVSEARTLLVTRRLTCDQGSYDCPVIATAVLTALKITMKNKNSNDEDIVYLRTKLYSVTDGRNEQERANYTLENDRILRTTNDELNSLVARGICQKH